MTCKEIFERIPSAYRADILDFEVAELPEQISLRTTCMQALRKNPPIVNSLTAQAALTIWGGHARGTSIDNHDIDLLSLWTTLPSAMVIGQNGMSHQKAWTMDGLTFDLTSKEISDMLGNVFKGSVNNVEMVFLPDWCYFQIDAPLQKIFHQIQEHPLNYVNLHGLLSSAFGYAHLNMKQCLNENQKIEDREFYKKLANSLFYLRFAQNIYQKTPRPYEQIDREEIIQIKKGAFTKEETIAKIAAKQAGIQTLITEIEENTQSPVSNNNDAKDQLLLDFAKYQLTKYNDIFSHLKK